VQTKVCPKCKEAKAFCDFHKHTGKPFDLAIWCKSCAKANSKKNYKEQDPKVRLEKKRSWQDNNRQYVNAYNNSWRKANPDKHAARQAERRATKKKATPTWLSEDQRKSITEVYKLCKKMEKTFRTTYHVDHIVPLNGENVCGLHVPWNLQILEASLNLRKSNKLEGE